MKAKKILSSLLVGLLLPLAGCNEKGPESSDKVDATAPEIIGNKTYVEVKKGESYNFLQGVVAHDDVDGEITTKIVLSTDDDEAVISTDGKSITFSNVGDYIVQYDVKDAAGNEATTVFTEVHVTKDLEKQSLLDLEISEGTMNDSTTLNVNTGASATKSIKDGRMQIKVANSGSAAEDVVLNIPNVNCQNQSSFEFMFKAYASKNAKVNVKAFNGDNEVEVESSTVDLGVNEQTYTLKVKGVANSIKLEMGKLEGQAEGEYDVNIRNLALNLSLNNQVSCASQDFSNMAITGRDIKVRGHNDERSNQYNPRTEQGKLLMNLIHCGDANDEGKNYGGGRQFGIPLNGVFTQGETYSIYFTMKSDTVFDFGVQVGAIVQDIEHEWDPLYPQTPLFNEQTVTYASNSDGVMNYSVDLVANYTSTISERLYLWFRCNNQSLSGTSCALEFSDISIKKDAEVVSKVEFNGNNDSMVGSRGLRNDNTSGYVTEYQYALNPRIADNKLDLLLRYSDEGTFSRKFAFKMDVEEAIVKDFNYRVNFKLDATLASHMAFHVGKRIDDSNEWDFYCEDRVFTWKEFSFTNGETLNYSAVFAAECDVATTDSLFFWFEANDSNYAWQTNHISIYDVSIDTIPGTAKHFIENYEATPVMNVINSGDAQAELLYDEQSYKTNVVASGAKADDVVVNVPLNNDQEVENAIVKVDMIASKQLTFNVKSNNGEDLNKTASTERMTYTYTCSLGAHDSLRFEIGNQGENYTFAIEKIEIEGLNIVIDGSNISELMNDSLFIGYTGRDTNSGCYVVDGKLHYKVHSVEKEVDWYNKISTREYVLGDLVKQTLGQVGCSATIKGQAGAKVVFELWNGTGRVDCIEVILDGTEQEIELMTSEYISGTNTSIYRIEFKFGFEENVNVVAQKGFLDVEISDVSFDIYN